jgi:large conductance mechanosensitive channel
MKKFFEEFKAFISKGDVVSMAVGLMVGSAFTAIITALNTNVLTPLLGILMGGINFADITFTVGSAIVEIGLFIQAIINFLITALVLFLVIKFFNSFKKQEEEAPAAPEEPAPVPEDVQLLTEIRDLLKERK